MRRTDRHSPDRAALRGSCEMLAIINLGMRTSSGRRVHHRGQLATVPSGGSAVTRGPLPPTVRRVASIAVAATLIMAMMVAASPAAASVLIDPPQRSIGWDGCLAMRIWYQSYSGGTHTITATVKHHGHVMARRHLRATTTWTKHTLACPNHRRAGIWTTTLTGGGWNRTFRTRVRAADGT